MAYAATVYRVMIASPGDVSNERRVARDVVHEWNAVHSHDRQTILLPVSWETHASPAMGDRAQEIINKQLVRDSDLLVGIFWTRIGTPTGTAKSGTVEEIEEHLRARKPVMLYFSSAPVRPDSVDEAQYRALREFKEWCRQQGLVEEYESIAEFHDKFQRQLAQTVMRSLPVTPTIGGVAAGSTTVIIGVPGATRSEDSKLRGLPEEGRQLLKEATKDRNGTVLMTETMGGLSIETNGRDFVSKGNTRSEAQWRRAIRELAERGLLEQRDARGEVFSITDEGYRVGDLLE
jgi:hypothetical protein